MPVIKRAFGVNTRLVLVLCLFLFACQPLTFKEVYNGYSSQGFHARGVASKDSMLYLSGAEGKITTFNVSSLAIVDTFSLSASDFRAVQYVYPHHLLLMNSGDTGLVYRYDLETRKADTVLFQAGAFFDALKIDDKGSGYLMGDPFNGRFLVYTTTNFGQTWQLVPNLPSPLSNEAGFAASNTGISLIENTVYIGTGAADTARLFRQVLGESVWKTINTPMPSGGSYGIYSCHFITESEGLIAGGSYVEKSVNDSVVFYTKNGGKSWRNRSNGLPGYTSCIVASKNGKLIVASGRLGVYYSENKGKQWQLLTKQPFYTASIIADKIVLSGKDGTLSIFQEIQ